MFGYVVINKPELKIREYERYHSFYCGLCHTLKQRHGNISRLTLTYDMTFLALLLTSLYEPATSTWSSRCLAHLSRKHLYCQNAVIEYCADMNIALAFHNFIDNWKDDRSIRDISAMHLIHNQYTTVRLRYPDTCRKIERYLHELALCEQQKITDIDIPAGCFGRLMGSLFLYKKDVWSPCLKRFGFYLGKFIYIMDAYLDLEEDLNKQHYNPLEPLSSSMSETAFTNTCKHMLELMISDASTEFEKLPLIQDAELLRNILYAGVWQKFDKIMQKKQPIIHNDKKGYR